MTACGEASAQRIDLERRCESAVRSRWPSSRTESLELLAGDASARRYARLRLAGGGAPKSVVTMILPPSDALASEELTSGGPPPELPFLNMQRYLAAHAVPVPEIFAAALDQGILVLEDIGDLTLAEAAARASIGERFELMRRAGDTLAQMAALASRPDPACVAFAQRYDRALIGRELAVVHAYGLASGDGGPPREPGSDPEVEDGLARLGDRIAAQPLVLMHRDYHPWNLHLDARGELRVIDFQDALLGPALYDLASLCTDRDSHRFVDPEIEAELVERFARRLAASGGPDLGSRGALGAAYFDAVAYRTLRVIGRFRFLAIEKGKPGYLRFLAPMAAQTRRALLARGERALLDALAARSAAFA